MCVIIQQIEERIMKKLVLFALVLVFSLTLLAQGKQSSDIDQWLYQQPDADQKTKADTLVKNDLIQVNYNKKSAHLALLMSLAVPGLGQYYADKSVLTTYIFPVLELAFIGGIVYYNIQGKDKADAYEKYATGEVIRYKTQDGTIKTGYRYNRLFQKQVQEILKGINQSDIYDNGYFRLDTTDTQHFYEDIGKYPHYVFGWMDWYYRFSADESGDFSDPHWVLDGPTDNPNTHWTGNYPLWGNDTAVIIAPDSPDASAMRQTYIRMRNEAKDQYSISHFFTMAAAFNHLAAGIDAVRVTRNRNRLYISQIPSMNIYANLHNGTVTPMLGMKWQF